MKRISRFLIALFAVGILFQPYTYGNAESLDWESSIATMKKGANEMIEGRKLMQQKKDPGSAEKRIKDGHRMMMNAEKDLIRAQNGLMRQGAKMMMDGLRVLKTKNDSGEAEKLMAQGQQMILEADKMMADTRPEKMMQGSRTMMRGLRMRQERDLNTADRLMTEGQGMMRDAEQEGKDKN
jgi:hypothetical protein